MILPKSSYAICLCLLFILNGLSINAQISSPGLGEARSAVWSAIGLKMPLDTLKHKGSMTYVGWGRKSDRNQMNPFKNQVIWGLSHEIYRSFSPHQQYAYGISYFHLTIYDQDVFNKRERAEQEFRFYGRYTYSASLGKRWIWKNTLRQEFTKFFMSDFGAASTNFQLRTRVKSQLTYALSAQKNHYLIFSIEELFAINRNHSKQKWSPYKDKETRVGLYYQFHWRKVPIVTDIGYANDLIRGFHSGVGGVHYLSLDMIWNL